LAIDPVAPMIATARERAATLQLSNIDFGVETADDIIPPSPPFDAVLGRFSFIFCVDPAETLRRVRSTMRPGGRIAVATWTPIGETPSPAAIAAALRRPTKIPPLDSSAPGRFQMSAPGELERVLEVAGFTEVDVARVKLYQFARDGAEYWRMTSEM